MSDPARQTQMAYKAYEIEELVDVYVFRRLGIGVAHAARLARLTPNAVSIIAGVVGVLGGSLLASRRWAPLGVVLIYVHGVFDSADGQLARLTGRTSELGRLLDGLAGYFTHVAVYVSVIVLTRREGGSWMVLPLVVAAGACTAIQAQMYDYYRTTYASVVVQRRAPLVDPQSGRQGGLLARVGRVYARVQRQLVGAHVLVEQAIANRSRAGVVAEADVQRYRASFYRLVRGWNVMGDNVRRYVLAMLVVLGHVEWFPAVTLVPLNLVLLGLWLWQQRADRRFLQAIGSPPTGG